MQGCKNCLILKGLHKIGRDCNNRVPILRGGTIYIITTCSDVVTGKVKNNLNVKVTG